jgi:hypothetical protein
MIVSVSNNYLEEINIQQSVRIKKFVNKVKIVINYAIIISTLYKHIFHHTINST